MNIANEKWETISEFPNYMISTESRVRWKKSGFYEMSKMNKVFSVCNQYANKVALGRNGNYV